MAIQASFFSRHFEFNFEARTSRGRMQDKVSWFIRIWDSRNPAVVGLGECGPLPGLSLDDRPDFAAVLADTVSRIPSFGGDGRLDIGAVPRLVPGGFPSLAFGLETAILDFRNGGRRIIFENDFSSGQAIPINGLIWMGDQEFMVRQVDRKIAEGFTCLKLKVGGLDFERECQVLNYIRTRYPDPALTLRLDANGAFKADALERLQQLAKFNIHSIEQPIQPGLPEMGRLCRTSPIPIALDEELIGEESAEEKIALLQRIRPQFIILKPTLHGGLRGCAAWIALAEELGISWWITSALESNIGLNAICQFAAGYQLSVPQGLGTGTLYTNNIPSPLVIRQGTIAQDPERHWDISSLPEGME
jgi:o-succinylbenzoate synthase